MIIHNPILTGSFTVNGTDVASITGSAASITAINAYTASQNILNGTYATTGSNTFVGIQTVNSNLVVTGSITAQTLVVQTITSSVVYSSGSNIFGNSQVNTQQFTGSVLITGSVSTTGALSGTSATFSGLITSTRGNASATVLSATSATTGGQKIDLINTSGRIMMGIEDSVGGSEVNGAPAYSAYLSSVNAQPLVFATSNIVRATITSGGNVGIGVTPSAWSTIVPMQILNTSYGASPNNLISYISSNVFFDGAFKYITTGTATQYRMNDSGTFSWLQAPSGTAGNPITFTTAMTITSGSNVGIGTSSPACRLDILGVNEVMNISGTNASSAYTGYYYNTSTLVGYIGNGSSILSGAASSDFIFRSQGALVYATNGNNERMRITSGGSVCINRNATPSTYPLVIKALTGDYIWKLYSTGETYMGDAYLNQSDGLFHIRNGSADVWLTQSAGGWSSNSDRSIKENLVKIDNALNKINQLNGYHYNIINDTENKQVGLIAQEVNEVLPEAISTHFSKTYERDLMGLDYDKLIPLLVEGIKELQAQITELKNK